MHKLYNYLYNLYRQTCINIYVYTYFRSRKQTSVCKHTSMCNRVENVDLCTYSRYKAWHLVKCIYIIYKYVISWKHLLYKLYHLGGSDAVNMNLNKTSTWRNITKHIDSPKLEFHILVIMVILPVYVSSCITYVVFECHRNWFLSFEKQFHVFSPPS